MTLRKISAKKLARGERYGLRKTKMKRSNPKRRKSEFARCYHSKERVAWVKTLPCIACGSLLGENAHYDNGGMGRKSDYTHIVPLCGGWYRDKENYRLGCHMMMHHLGRDWLEKKYSLDLEAVAAETQQSWLDHLNSKSSK